jgi:hypothetical protein
MLAVNDSGASDAIATTPPPAARLAIPPQDHATPGVQPDEASTPISCLTLPERLGLLPLPDVLSRLQTAYK